MINNNINSGFSQADRLRNEQNQKAEQNKVASQPKPNAPPSSSEQVQLSTGAQQLKSMENKLAKLPDVDHDRVAEVKAKLENGELNIDNEQLAEKILASDLLLNN